MGGTYDAGPAGLVLRELRSCTEGRKRGEGGEEEEVGVSLRKDKTQDQSHSW